MASSRSDYNGPEPAFPLLLQAVLFRTALQIPNTAKLAEHNTDEYAAYW